jgi:hypothetical protein
VGLYGICIGGPWICTGTSWNRIQHPGMDLIAVALAVVAFIAFIGLIELVDRI